MLKNKLKDLVQNKIELTQTSFKVISDIQSSMIIGGCDKLHTCYILNGDCKNLRMCKTYNEITTL